MSATERVPMYLTPGEAARRLGITPGGVRAMEARNELPVAARTESGGRLFRPSDVDRLARKRQAQRQGEP